MHANNWAIKAQLLNVCDIDSMKELRKCTRNIQCIFLPPDEKKHSWRSKKLQIRWKTRPSSSKLLREDMHNSSERTKKWNSQTRIYGSRYIFRAGMLMYVYMCKGATLACYKYKCMQTRDWSELSSNSFMNEPFFLSFVEVWIIIFKRKMPKGNYAGNW